MRLDGKVVIITGAASGIGLASARMFGREGARLVLGDIDERAGGLAAEEIGGAGGQAAFVRTDVASDPDVQRLVSTAVDRYGKLDIIFNNAGIHLVKPILESTEEDFDRVVAINLKGVFLGCKYSLPHLMENPDGGVIVNMSSSGGLVGRPNDPLYGATKFGVIGLTKSLALTYADQKVRANALCPGPIDTPIVSRAYEGSDVDREMVVRRAVASSPTPRVADAEEVASAALFLASDDASFVNGAALPVDGGKSAGLMKDDRYRTDFGLFD